LEDGNSKEQRERHVKVKAWNEYVIDYYALIIEKKIDTGYLSVVIFQGRFCIYSDVVYPSHSFTPYQIHERLREFLKRYIWAIKPFGIVYEDANFKPPEV